MWKSLPKLAVLVNFILTVTSAKDTHTIITVQNKAEAGSIAGVDAGNDTAVAGAAASASSSTIIKTHHHHTSCGNDKNSTFGCGVNCGRRCSNYDQGAVKCAETCYTNSCECKAGYVFDDYRGYCVIPEDCSNKDEPEPEGTEGTKHEGTGAGTEDPNNGDRGSENATTPQETNRPKITTATSSGDLNSTTEESGEGHSAPNNEGEDENKTSSTENSGSSQKANLYSNKSYMTTKGYGPDSTTGPSGMDTTTRGSGIGSSTHANKTTKKRRVTTIPSSTEPGSSTVGSEKTTESTGPESTTGDSGMKLTTKLSRSEATTGGSGIETTNGDPEMEPETEKSGSGATKKGSGTETVTEGSGILSTTHTHKKKIQRRTTTTASTGVPGSSTEGSQKTTGGTGPELTTGDSEMDLTTEESVSETAIGSSGMGSTIYTHKKKRRTTTTASSGGPGLSTEESEITTVESDTKMTTGGSDIETTVEGSGIKSTIHHNTKKHKTTSKAPSRYTDSITDGSELTTEDYDIETTTDDSGMETTTEDTSMETITRDSSIKMTTEDSDMDMKTEDSSDAGIEVTTEWSRSEATTEGSEIKASTRDSGMESATGGSGMRLTTHTHEKKKRHRTTTTASTGRPGSITEGSQKTTDGAGPESTTGDSEIELTTERSGSENSTRGSGMETATEGSGMGSTTHTHKKKKRRRTTTTASSGGPGFSTEGSKMTTEESVRKTTTRTSGIKTTEAGSGIKSTTHHNTKKHKTTTTAPSEYTDSTTNASEKTTEVSDINMTTEDSSMETTTENSGMETTTDDSDMETITEDSGMETTTGGSDIKTTTGHSKKETTEDDSNRTTQEKSSSTEASTTTKRTNKQRTTTKSSGANITHRPKTTRKPRPTTTRRPKRTKTPRTTTASRGETTIEGTETTKNTDGSNGTTSTDDSHTTIDSSMTTTHRPATTMKGRDDCKSRNERYFLCAPSCPQKTCADYLNDVKCPKVIGHPICKAECRCRIGYYKDEEGNCLSSSECRRRARSTTAAMASSGTSAKPDNQDTTASSSTTMMSTTPEPKCEDVAMELFVIGNLRYTTKLLTANYRFFTFIQDLSERDPGNNIVVGGASTLFLFAQIVLGAKEKVKTEILEVLNLNETEQVRCLLPNISAELTGTYPDIQYDLFCKIYAEIKNALRNDFIQRIIRLFVRGPENLNMSSSEAAQKINSDVAQYTHDNFLNFVKPGILSPLKGLVLTDAEYFQGKWEKQFHEKDTVMKDFSSQGRVEKILTMRQRGLFLYVDSHRLNAKILKLKYRGGRFSLAIILPRSFDGIRDVLRRMENPRNTASAFDSLKYENVEIDLPKFNISVANRLKMSSEMANLKEVFNNATTGLEDIGSAEPPYVSDILQKINLQVNEYGMGDKWDPEFPEESPRITKSVTKQSFKANHPFIYVLIFDKVVLQAGLFVH